MSIELQTVCWLGLSLQVPAAWELLQFSRERASGNLAWGDRYEFRLELTWKEAQKPPDLQRVMADYRASLAKDDQPQPEETSWGEWRGLIEQFAGGTSRFGRYEATTGRLLELVFLWKKQRDLALERAVLNSVGPADHWQAFGLEVRVPEMLALTECVVQPANVQWTFSDSKARHSWHFERLGMLDSWLHVELPAWLIGKEPLDLQDREPAEEEVAGHRVATVTGYVPALKFPRFSKRSARFRGAAWICPGDQRLYHASMIVPRDFSYDHALFGDCIRCCASSAARNLEHTA